MHLESVLGAKKDEKLATLALDSCRQAGDKQCLVKLSREIPIDKLPLLSVRPARVSEFLPLPSPASCWPVMPGREPAADSRKLPRPFPFGSLGLSLAGTLRSRLKVALF